MDDKLQIQVYTDIIAELSAIHSFPPQFDLTDSPLPASLVSTFTSDPTFVVTPPISADDMFELDFNHANTFFGINDLFGNNIRGAEFRMAVAHLIDKQAFITKVLGGLANPLDNPLPPGQSVIHPGLPFDPTSQGTGPYTNDGYNLVGVCNWDVLHTGTGTGCLSAFHDGADITDSTGLVTASNANPDFCAAAQELVNAGLATAVNTGTDCSVAGHFIGTGSITIIAPDDSPPRLALGHDLAFRLCELINGAGLTSCAQISFNNCPILGCAAPLNTRVVQLGWHIYAGAHSLTPQFDQLYNLYNSKFASNACGGTATTFGPDYVYYCNPSYDHYSSMVEFNDTVSGAVASAQMAMQIFGQSVATIPIWSGNDQYAYLNGWTGVNNADGFGPPNFFSLLNMWNPTPAITGTIRWGFSAGTANLNPFLATTPQELYVVRSVYDSLIRTAPYNETTPFGWMASQFTLTPPLTGDPPGTVQDIQINLRNNIFWHDGLPVTASDVKFSLLGYQETGGLNAAPLAGLIDVTIMGNFGLRVSLDSKSIFSIFNVGSVPILPQHVWASDTTTKCLVKGSPACTVNTSLITVDPVVNHLLIGSGGWMCVDLFTGQVGGGCTRTATGTQGTQAVDAGGTIVLQRFGFNQPGYDSTHSYSRGSRLYKVFQWADRLGQGTFNIVDVSNAGGCWNKPVSTNPGCAHWVSPASTITCVAAAGSCNAQSLTNTANGGNNEAQMSIAEVSELGALWQQSWNYPVAYTSFLGAQPIPQTLYEGGITYSGSAPA